MKLFTKLSLLVITLMTMLPAHAFIGKIFKRGVDKDEEVKVRPPPVYDIKYVSSTKDDNMVFIDLTSPDSRHIDLQRTGWIVHQGQRIVLQDFELKGGKYVWDHDFSSCKDTYFKKDEQNAPPPEPQPVQGKKGKPNPKQKQPAKKKLKIPIPVMLTTSYSRWSRIQQNSKSLRIRGPAANAFWYLTLPKEDRRQKRETPGVRLSEFKVLNLTQTNMKNKNQKTTYVQENDIKCQIKMTLWERNANNQKPRDQSKQIWRRLNINLLIKAPEKIQADEKAVKKEDKKKEERNKEKKKEEQKSEKDKAIEENETETNDNDESKIQDLVQQNPDLSNNIKLEIVDPDDELPLTY